LTPERWAEVKRLCDGALARSGDARRAFLEDVCADDDSLRREVESLLAQASGGSGFLSTQAGARPSGHLSDGPSLIGHQLGAYRIVRMLGRGGMGQVYEAEHRDTDRRVALKILDHALPSSTERARFLREGQLAASINHPNCVYVFATEEIAGTLAIIMELATGGTLEDVVQTHGPLAPAAAIDAILQVMDGLEAAAAAGVLHRDVKPSNCFVDGDGTVKVGDFGLSLAARAQDETKLTLVGTVLGTPAFAPPEQIRGGSVDVRSDLYSTGATLYYLLTGQPPFTGDGLVQIVANVLERDAISPRRLKPDVPDALGQIVLRCLAKNPSERPDGYQRLRLELLPFSSQAPTPATPGARVTAAIFDLVFSALPVTAGFALLNARALGTLSPVRVTADFVAALLYFVLLEGIGGASLGKMMSRLQVVGPSNRRAGVGRIIVRTLLYLSSSFVPVAILLIVPALARTMADETMARGVIYGAALFIGFGLLFSTARRSNGFAGLHDLASRTRVVRRVDWSAREPLSIPRHLVEVTPEARHIGPYAILDTHTDQDVDRVLLAYDQILRRHVWIHVMPLGAPAVAPARRDLARPGRLRWLTGKRTPVECWDAYDAPEGIPFVTIGPDRRSWSAARFWLLDVARELEAIVADHADVALDPEHVWITESGRAMLLDFRCPGLLPPHSATAVRPPSQRETTDRPWAFVRLMATVSLRNTGPLPLHAHAFLTQLEQRRFPSLEAMAAALQETLGRRAVLTRDRRAAHLALSAVVPTCALMAGLTAAVLRGGFNPGGIIAPLAFSLIFTTNLAVWSAAGFRGGLMLRALDIAVVSSAGREASRQRAFLRAIVAWSPCLFFLFAILFGWTALGIALLVLMVSGAVIACLNPERGLQDRIVRTRLVPR
jgi:hypothetical protein